MSGNPRSRVQRIRTTAVCLLAVLCGAVAARSEIIGDVVRVGYLVTTGAAIRTGSWTPVVVDLTLQNQTAFDGVLRLRQFDRDGDIYVDRVPVHLSDSGAGAQQRYWLYTVANPQSDRTHDYSVELLATEDDDEVGANLVQVISGGVPVPAMSPPLRPEPLSDDAYLILEISDGAMGPIRHLLDQENLERFDRRMAVAHGSPNDLPGNWIGLDMVDCVVWEDADPTQLTPAQLHALVQWVEQGGQLVLAAGRTSDAVAQSGILGPLLPMQVGRVQSTKDLPTVRNKLLGIGSATQTVYDRPVVYAECTAVADPAVTKVLYDEGAQSTLVAARRVGSGRLVFVAASLGDLLADGQANIATFFEHLLELRRTPLTDSTVSVSPVELFYHLDREVGFYQTGGALLAVAIIFAVAYVLLATLGVWKVLQKRSLLKQSWTALAVTALVASVLSLLGVQTLHGVGRKVQQLTIVDGTANQVAAQATAYFGLRTGTHNRLDIWLPSDYRLETEPTATACTLKPMLEARTSLEKAAAFTDPTRYWLLPSTAEMHDVPIRATLKQFEGRWRGDLHGTILSSVRTTDLPVPAGQEAEATSQVYTVAPGSWIENTLDVDLYNCLLFVAEYDTMSPQSFIAVPQRTMGLQAMKVFSLGEIPAGERIDLHARLNLDGSDKQRAAGYYKDRALAAMAKEWGKAFISVGEMTRYGEEPVAQYRFDYYQNALLLLTVLSDIDPGIYPSSPIYGIRMFSRTRARQLDVANLVQRDAALLVGFAQDPGPVRLCARTSGAADYDVLDPAEDAAHTMYRFVIPIEQDK